MTDTEAFKALCAEAKDLMKRLEGSSVQRVTVEADGARIEVERGAATLVAAPAVNGEAAVAVGAPITAAMAISPGARGASGEPEETDDCQTAGEGLEPEHGNLREKAPASTRVPRLRSQSLGRECALRAVRSSLRSRAKCEVRSAKRDGSVGLRTSHFALRTSHASAASYLLAHLLP